MPIRYSTTRDIQSDCVILMDRGNSLIDEEELIKGEYDDKLNPIQ